MRKILIANIMSLLLMFWSVDSFTVSSGAPPSSTGAPGERNCTESGCHDDNTQQLGDAILSLDFQDSNLGFEPNKKHLLTIKIKDNSFTRFGFQLLALDETGQNVGDWNLVEPSRTQATNGIQGLENRKYVTYTFDGTQPTEPGLGAWQIEWVAPSQDPGQIRFYLAGLTANNDGTDKGDFVYNLQKTVSFSNNPLADEKGIAENPVQISFLSGNSQQPLIFHGLNNADRLNINLLQLNGSLVQSWNQIQPQEKLILNIKSRTIGIYLISVTQGNQTQAHKILVNP